MTPTQRTQLPVQHQRSPQPATRTIFAGTVGNSSQQADSSLRRTCPDLKGGDVAPPGFPSATHGISYLKQAMIPVNLGINTTAFFRINHSTSNHQTVKLFHSFARHTSTGDVTIGDEDFQEPGSMEDSVQALLQLFKLRNTVKATIVCSGGTRPFSSGKVSSWTKLPRYDSCFRVTTISPERSSLSNGSSATHTTLDERLQEESETPTSHITSIEQASPKSTSHGVQGCFPRSLHSRTTSSSHVPDPAELNLVSSALAVEQAQGKPSPMTSSCSSQRNHSPPYGTLWRQAFRWTLSTRTAVSDPSTRSTRRVHAHRKHSTPNAIASRTSSTSQPWWNSSR